jgi:hypothetical protein
MSILCSVSACTVVSEAFILEKYPDRFMYHVLIPTGYTALLKLSLASAAARFTIPKISVRRVD